MAVSKLNNLNKSSGIRILMLHDNRSEISDVKRLLHQIDRSILFTSSISLLRFEKKLKETDIVIFCLKSSNRKSAGFISLLCEKKAVPVVTIGNTKKEMVIRGLKTSDSLLWKTLDKSTLSETIFSAMKKKAGTGLTDHSSKNIQNTEKQIADVFNCSTDGIVIVNKFNKIKFMNPAAQKIFSMQNSTSSNTVFPYKTIAGTTRKLSIVFPDRKTSCFEMRASQVKWENQTDAQMVILRKMTKRNLSEKNMKANEERYVIATKSSNSGLWDWNLKSGQIFFCDQWKNMLGLGKTDKLFTEDDWLEMIHVDDRENFKKAIDRHLQGRSPLFECEHRIIHANGEYRWVLVRGTALCKRNGKPSRFAGLQIDITERKEAEKELKNHLDDLKFALASEKILMDELDRKNKELIELSITDGLTGMYNHRFLQERFDYEFKRIRRYGGMLSCILIDIDHFKIVNDTYGHQIGDMVLCQIATIMKNNSREIDICGRYGGEEFMIITNLLIDNAIQYATKLHAAIDNHVFECGSNKIHITVSIGIAEYNSDVKTKQELIERADTAMYKAKMDGRNLIRIWKDAEKVDDNITDRLGIQEMKGKFQAISKQIRFIYMESTNALIKAVDAKDPFAREHSKNVSEYSKEIAKYMKLSEQEIEIIHYAGMLHDIGKIGIKDDILIKKEELTVKENDLLRSHPEVGVNILKEIKFFEKEIPIILHHHERFDGTGYPHGLRGREIPLGARIIAVADAFDAMTSGRTYKNRKTWKMAADEIRKASGTQFAPEIVNVFLELIEIGKIAPRSNKVME